MGTSFVDLRGRGFWTSDGKLGIGLHLLTLAVPRRAGRPEWLDEAREDWHVQATVGFTGCVSAGLDHWIGDRADRADRLLTVAELAEHAQQVLQETGTLGRDDLEAARLGGPGQWAADLDARVVLLVAEAFSALLRGEVVGDSRTSPVL